MDNAVGTTFNDTSNGVIPTFEILKGDVECHGLRKSEWNASLASERRLQAVELQMLLSLRSIKKRSYTQDSAY